MKTKLLKKLRKRFTIQKRNNEYRFFETVICLGDVYNQSKWTTDINICREIQRSKILEFAQNWKEPKQTI